jgi:hypothetical protein
MSIEDLAAQQRRETTERAKRHAKRQDDAVFLRSSGSALIGGDTVSVSSGSNGPFVPGQAAAFLAPGVVDVPSRVGVSPVAIPSVMADIDCILPGVMVYQYIVTYYRPSSFYAAFDNELHVTERIIWFTNDGSKTTLYERISAPRNSAGFPDVQLASKNHFWSDTDGTGQVCFRYRPTRSGPEFDDIWELTPIGATRLSTQQSPSNSQYKGGSLGVSDTSANPGYLLRESPRTVQNAYPTGGTGGAYLSVGGTDYPVYERYSNGVRANSYISTLPAEFCFYMPTMAGKYPLQYSLDFQPGGLFGIDGRQTGFSQNGKIAALVSARTYSLQVDGSFEANTLPGIYISARPIKLNIGTLGNFNQFPPLPIPPFSTNERYWISSGVSVEDITPSEGIGSNVWVLGSYLNASKNCLIKNSTDLVKVAFGTPYVLNDPNAPI